jgi:putative isomerase
MNRKSNLGTKWHGGQLIAFSGLDGPTSYENGLVARTTVSPDGVEIMDPGIGKLIFADQPLKDVLFATDHFRFETGKRPVVGVLLDAYHLLIDGPCTATGLGDAIELLQEGDRTLVGVKANFDPALVHIDIELAFENRRRWLVKQTVPGNLPPKTERTLFRALSMMKGQVYAPEGVIHHRWTTPDRWPHKDMWLWDSAFHAIGWRHWDVALAREMIDAVFDVQQPDGFVPHRMSPRGAASVFTQPPILGYAVKLVNEGAPNMEWLKQIYPRLCAYIEWDLKNRDSDGGGLVEWVIEEHPECRSGESGMDNSPRFDAAVALDAIDFNSFLALECEVLSEFAQILGLKGDVVKWAERHKKLCGLINERLWSDKDQFYYDYDPQRKERSPVLSSAGFLPLICGAASHEQAKSLAKHLADPDMFATSFPVPSIAVRDWKDYSKDMWRGPSWVNINWFIAQGFERYGMKDHAETLRTATAMEIERTCEKFGTFFEYFDDKREVEPPQLLRKGVCAPELNPYRQVIHEFGWTATLYVDLIMKRRGVVAR